MKTLSKNWKNVLVLVLNFCYNLNSGKNILKTPIFTCSIEKLIKFFIKIRKPDLFASPLLVMEVHRTLTIL